MRIQKCLLIVIWSFVANPLWADDAAPGSETKKGEVCKDGKRGDGNPRREATHKQSRVLTPMHDSKKVSLNTYCLTRDGELLVCVGGPSVEYLPNADNPDMPEVKQVKSPSYVQKYSADGELLAEFPVDFKPTGINMVPETDQFVVAGEGWLARMTLSGETLKTGRTPNIGDLEEFKAKSLEAAKEQVKEYTEQFEGLLSAAEKTIATLEETPESERTANVTAQIEAQKAIAKQYKQQISQFEQMFGVNDPDAAVRDRLTVTGVAVTGDDVFVSVRKLKGHGYDVWRTNHDFTLGEKVVEDLGGCCGQLDIQASHGSLLIAENGKFRVGIYDRDGEMTKSFGNRARKGSEGFGSCCNPMNVRCCDNGDVLTAESSIGDIKRFSPDGELLGYVGRAKIGGGCKHVAIAFDAKRDRYYMQHQDKGHICVLVPLSEITGPSEDELLEKAAREGLGKKLIGSWSVPNLKKSKNKGGLFSLLNSAFGGGNEPSSTPGDKITFGDGDQLKTAGGYFANYGSDLQMEWKPVRQDGDTLTVGIVIDGVETFDFKVTFVSDNDVKVELRYDENVMASSPYVRDEVETATKTNDSGSTDPDTTEISPSKLGPE